LRLASSGPQRLDLAVRDHPAPDADPETAQLRHHDCPVKAAAKQGGRAWKLEIRRKHQLQHLKPGWAALIARAAF